MTTLSESPTHPALLSRVVGVEGLSAAEVNLLRTILKLSTKLVVDWTLNEQGPCDVLLTANAGKPDGIHEGLQARIVVPVVRRGDSTGGEFLERPFRAEDFVALLGRLAPALNVGAPAASPIEAAQAPADRRGRLKRWPPSQLMGSSRERLQLATLLSRRSRSASELSAVAGYPESQCSAFMQELEKHDLLSWEMPGRPEQIQQPAPTLPASTNAGERPSAPGLLGSIRRRLGLSWNSRSAG